MKEEMPHKKILRALLNRAPMLRVVLSLMAGILLAEYLPAPPVRVLVAGVGVCFVLEIVAAFSKKLGRHIFAPVLWLTLILTGWLITSLRTPADPFAEPPGECVMLFRLQDTPRKTPKCYKVEAEVEAVRDSLGWHTAEGRMMLNVRQDSAATHLAFGSRIIARGTPQVPSNSLSHSGFDYQKYLRRKGILWQCFVDTAQWKTVVAKNTFSLRGWSKQLQQRLVLRIRSCRLTPSQQGIAEALLLGWRDDVDEPTQQHFRDAGITHLLCVSGLHVGIVAWIVGALLFFLGSLRWQRMVKGLVQILAVWFFVLLTGLAPSTMRAGIMFSILIVGKMFSQRPNLVNNLATSAFLLLCFRPMLLFDVGFQLSYAAVLGIGAFYDPLCELIPFENIPFKWNPMHRLWQLICLSTSAQLGTLPLVLYHFHQFPTYFLIANVTIVPLAGLLLGTVLLMVLSMGWPWLCEGVTWLLRCELTITDNLTAWVGSLPHAVLDVPSFDLPRAILTTVALLLIALMFRWPHPSIKN